jgi:hypothetical protein
MSRRSVLAALALLLVSAAVTGTSLAAFSSTTTNTSNLVTAKRIFPVTESTPPWTISDQADTTAANMNDQGAYLGDGRNFDTGPWSNAFSGTRYVEVTYASPLPPGLTISNLSFDMNYRPNNSGDTVCFYFEVRRASNNALLGTHGSTGSPVQCATGASYTASSTPLPEITTSADANDLKLRVYARNTGSRPLNMDRGTVSGTASNGYGSFVLAETHYMDQASGSPFNFPFPLNAAEATSVTYSAWATTFNASRYVQFTFPSDFVPAGATILDFDYTSRFRSSTSGRSTCVWYEFRTTSGVITTRGSTGTPFGCSDTSNNWKTDAIDVGEIDTPAEVNGLIVRFYGRDTGPVGSAFDQQQISVAYHLD